MKLSSAMVKVLTHIHAHPKAGHTVSTVGVMITARQSSYGHQTSAREGGRLCTSACP